MPTISCFPRLIGRHLLGAPWWKSSKESHWSVKRLKVWCAFFPRTTTLQQRHNKAALLPQCYDNIKAMSQQKLINATTTPNWHQSNVVSNLRTTWHVGWEGAPPELFQAYVRAIYTNSDQHKPNFFPVRLCPRGPYFWLAQGAGMEVCLAWFLEEPSRARFPGPPLHGSSGLMRGFLRAQQSKSKQSKAKQRKAKQSKKHPLACIRWV